MLPLTLQLFDRIQDLALSQNIVDTTSLQKICDTRLTYIVMGRRVCYAAFAILHGVGKTPRLDTIRKSVFAGARSCPVDQRYLETARKLQPSPTWGDIHSYLRELYDSVAETMPEEERGKLNVDDENDNYQPPHVQSDPHLQEQNLEQPSEERRLLPPGSMCDTWKQYVGLGGRGGFKLFWNVWKQDFSQILGFRSTHQHSVCTVCIKHRLLIRALGHDLRARTKQRSLYERHLKSQYCDRKVYWRLRAESRLLGGVICFIMDGMDQAKFAWPRAKFFTGHEFDSWQRPRLHITGILVHGFFSMLTLSHADVSKSSSTTIDLIAHLLTILANTCGVDVSQCHLHIQLDNTSSTNKNNYVLQFIALLCAVGLVKTFTASFLRVGHTHEDIFFIKTKQSQATTNFYCSFHLTFMYSSVH